MPSVDFTEMTTGVLKESGFERVARQVKDWRGQQVDLTEGVKLDGGKLRYDLIPHDVLKEFVKVLTFGATKYEDRNWEKGIKYGRCYAAALRHLTAWWEGEDLDPETGISHLAHALCCINFLLAFELRGMLDYDDRPHPDGGTIGEAKIREENERTENPSV